MDAEPIGHGQQQRVGLGNALIGLELLISASGSAA
jgi:hypothetical protein